MKKRLTLFLAITLVLSLAACSESTIQDSSADPTHGNQIGNDTTEGPGNDSSEDATDSGDTHEHTFADATCTDAQTCSVCGATNGDALGHDLSEATCTSPMTCSRCGYTEGAPSAHSWKDATCTSPKTCTICGTTDGDTLNHSFYAGSCTVCSTEDPDWIRVTSNDGIFSIAIPRTYNSLVTNPMAGYSSGIGFFVGGIEHIYTSFSVPIEFEAVLNSDRDTDWGWGNTVDTIYDDTKTIIVASNGEYTVLCHFYLSSNYVQEGEDAAAYIQAILDMRSEICDSLQWE